MEGEIVKDEWGRYARVTGFRHGYLVCQKIDKYGRRTGGMCMYCHSEIKPARLATRPAKKKAKRKAVR